MINGIFQNFQHVKALPTIINLYGPKNIKCKHNILHLSKIRNIQIPNPNLLNYGMYKNHKVRLVTLKYYNIARQQIPHYNYEAYKYHTTDWKHISTIP